MFISVSTATIINGEYIASLSKTLNTTSLATFTSSHRLTIATDRQNYIEIFVDNMKVYSSNTLPVSLSGTNLDVNFYQFTNVNNMTASTTWSNFLAYGNNKITVSGLKNGMTVVVNGTNGFQASAIGNSSGMATVDVSLEPLNLSVSVELNGQIIVTYGSQVQTGASLKLVTTSSTSST